MQALHHFPNCVVCVCVCVFWALRLSMCALSTKSAVKLINRTVRGVRAQVLRDVPVLFLRAGARVRHPAIMMVSDGPP